MNGGLFLISLCRLYEPQFFDNKRIMGTMCKKFQSQSFSFGQGGGGIFILGYKVS